MKKTTALSPVGDTPRRICWIILHRSNTPLSGPGADPRCLEGHHLYLDRHGGLHHLLPLNQAGQHTHGFNHHSLSLCIEGGVDRHGAPDDTCTHAQQQALDDLLSIFRQVFPQAAILGCRRLEAPLPRGLRNANPGNLRRTADAWKGLRAQQTDPEFFQFTHLKWGYRALFITLRTYRKKHRCRTLRQIIRRWAPPGENPVDAYLSAVCRLMQQPPGYEPDVYHRATMLRLAAAITRVENGRDASPADLEAGWELI